MKPAARPRDGLFLCYTVVMISSHTDCREEVSHMSADVKLYFWDAEQSPDWPPTEEQVASFPASYSKRYREAKAESVRQQACGSAFLLAMHLGVRSDEQLERGAHGKLMLKNDLRFFCLSHSGPVTGREDRGGELRRDESGRPQEEVHQTGRPRPDGAPFRIRVHPGALRHFHHTA